MLHIRAACPEGQGQKASGLPIDLASPFAPKGNFIESLPFDLTKAPLLQKATS